MSEPKPKACPECQSNDLEVDSAQGGSWVQCRECEFKLQQPCSEAAVIQRWNKLTNTKVNTMKTEKHAALEMPNPTEADLASPAFEAIWQVIKSWNINVPSHYEGYCGANGSHVKLILDGLDVSPE